MYNYSLSLAEISARNETRRRAQVRRRRRVFKIKQTLYDIACCIGALLLFYSPCAVTLAISFTCKQVELRILCYVLSALCAIPLTIRVIEYIKE